MGIYHIVVKSRIAKLALSDLAAFSSTEGNLRLWMI
jgi:hypothetical protein